MNSNTEFNPTSFKAIIETISNGLVVYEAVDHGEDFVLTYFNAGAERIEKLGREAVVGRRVTEVFPAVRKFGLFEILQRVWRTGESERFPIAFYQDDRIAGWRDNHVFKLESGEVAAIYEDVTERKRSEAELIRSEERLRNVALTSGDWIWEVDADGRYVFASKSVERIFGYPSDQLIGKTPFDFMPPETAVEVRKAFAEAVADRKPLVDLVNWNVHKDGTQVCLQTNGIPVFDDDGTFKGYFGVDKDITAQKIAERAVHESEARLRALLDATPAAIGFKDIAGHYLIVNDEFRKMYGRRMDEIVGRTAEEFMPETQHKEALARDEKVLDSRQTLVEEANITIENGASQQSLVVKFPIFDEEQDIVGLGVFIADVGPIKRAEAELRRLQNELAHVGRISAMGEMAAGFAHELNQPLAAMGSYARGGVRRVLDGTLGNEDSARLLELIGEQAERAGEVIRRIRAFVIKEDPRRVETDVNATIEEVVKLLASEAVHAEISVHFSPSASVGPFPVDPIGLQQVVLNLVRNAIDALSESHRDSRIVTIETDSDGAGGVNITVADKGPGIPTDLAEKVFEPFFSTKPAGTGMGLSICRRIVKAHGGEIHLLDAEPHGTTMIFRLPHPDTLSNEFKP